VASGEAPARSTPTIRGSDQGTGQVPHGRDKRPDSATCCESQPTEGPGGAGRRPRARPAGGDSRDSARLGPRRPRAVRGLERRRLLALPWLGQARRRSPERPLTPHDLGSTPWSLRREAENAMSDQVESERVGAVTVVRLRRPEAHNALAPDML